MFKRIKSEIMFQGEYLTYRNDLVELENTKRQTILPVIEHPGAVVILPKLEDKLILIKQTRYAVNENLW